MSIINELLKENDVSFSDILSMTYGISSPQDSKSMITIVQFGKLRFGRVGGKFYYFNHFKCMCANVIFALVWRDFYHDVNRLALERLERGKPIAKEMHSFADSKGKVSFGYDNDGGYYTALNDTKKYTVTAAEAWGLYWSIVADSVKSAHERKLK